MTVVRPPAQQTIEYVKEYVVEGGRKKKHHHHKSDDMQLVIERRKHRSRSPSPFVRWAAGR
jgi:hypothetical protein